MVFSLTTEIINFLLRSGSPPIEVREKAIEHILDGIAVMLAGSRTACARKLVDFVQAKGCSGKSTIISFDLKTTASDAALVNGTSGHADDYDDTQLSTASDRIYGLMTHPTVPVLASALAVGETVGCSGIQLIDAFIAGFEVECKLAEVIKPEHYRRGFHSTATIGTFGSLAAAGKLMGLDEERLRFAIGIAASMSSGIRANFGTMTKPLHAGMSASNGIISCMLGERCFTSDRNALDGRWGFMEVLGGGADYEFIMGKMGNPYALIHPGATLKMYPCGSLGQPSMDALLEIIRDERIGAEEVREVRIKAGPNILEPLRYIMPMNELQAKFSLQFGLASILLRRRAGLREYVMEWVMDPTLREMMKKVKTVYSKELARMGVDKMRSIVELELKDGRIFSRVADTARGTLEKPLKSYELDDKFRECASFVLDKDKTEKALDVIRGLQRVSEITELTSLL